MLEYGRQGLEKIHFLRSIAQKVQGGKKTCAAFSSVILSVSALQQTHLFSSQHKYTRTTVLHASFYFSLTRFILQFNIWIWFLCIASIVRASSVHSIYLFIIPFRISHFAFTRSGYQRNSSFRVCLGKCEFMLPFSFIFHIFGN